MADVGFELACHGGCAEAAVQEPDVVGFALQDADDGDVDAAGGGDLPEQVGVLAGPGWRDATPGGAGPDLARGQPEHYAGVVGHVEAVGDALEDVRVADAPDAVDDFADPALAEADRGPDAGLAEPGVLAWISVNSAPMSRLRSAWQTSGRSQKAAGIDGGSNALARMAVLRSSRTLPPM